MVISLGEEAPNRVYYPRSRSAMYLPLYRRGSNKNMKRLLILGGFLLGAAFVAPSAATADDHHDKRYYDKEGHDYHVYNNQEDRAYRVYLGEQHQDYHAFGKAKPAQQQMYFKWRHEHPDSVLFKVEIK